MLALPLIMQRMERFPWFKSRPILHAPFQVLGVGCFLMMMVPTGCSLWPQNMTIQTESLRYLINIGALSEYIHDLKPKLSVGAMNLKHMNNWSENMVKMFQKFCITTKDCKVNYLIYQSGYLIIKCRV